MEETLSETALPAKKDDAAAASGEEGTSQAPVSRAEFDKLQRTILDLSSKLDKGLAANRQSATDVIKSEVSRAQKTQQDFLIERLSKTLPQGQSLEVLQREAWMDAQMAAPSAVREDRAPEEPVAPASAASLIQSEIKAILDETSLVGDEPELVEYVRAHKGERWFQAGPGFHELALKIAARNVGSAAGVSPGRGGRVPSSDLEAAYKAEVAQARRDHKYGLDNLRAIRSKFRERGLENVDDISLSDIDLSLAPASQTDARELAGLLREMAGRKHP